MIEFLTLFLGLVAGVHPLELTAVDAVAAVEIRLDGGTVARLEEPPWRTSLDLGSELLPHVLEAIAYDAAGEELDRTSQRLNLPRSPAELRLVLERDAAGVPTAVTLSWESLSGGEPSRVAASLDGRALEVEDGHRAALPPLDLAQLHFLSAEIEFPDHNLARSEITFGGSYGAEIRTELSSVLLRLPKRVKPVPAVAELSGWIRRDGVALEVVAVEHGPADVVVVRDRAADDLISRLRVEGQRVKTPARTSRLVGVRTQIDPEHLRWEMKLGTEDRIRFLWPVLERVDHPRYTLQLFETSMAFTAEHGGMHWLLTRVPAPWRPEAKGPVEALEQHLADAVAVAGLRAASGHRRRLVVLVLGAEAADSGYYRPPAVRRYLAALGVPLRVWAEKRGRQGEDLEAAGWGEITRIATTDRLRQAVRDARQELDRQLVVWVAGEHLQRNLTLDAPPGVELVR